MRALLFVMFLSLSLASIAESRAADPKKEKKSAKVSKLETKKTDGKKIDKKSEDCETKEEILKKINEPKPEALQVKPTTDGLGLKGATTGCSL